MSYEDLFNDAIKFFYRTFDSNSIYPYYTYIQSDSIFPPVRILQQKENKYMILEFALSGFKKEDIDVTTEDEYLIVTGERKPEKYEDTIEVKNNLKITKFKKTFEFPDALYDYSNPAVKLEDGLLTIKINKNPELIKEKRKIEIK
jgi:HSP20 family protein